MKYADLIGKINNFEIKKIIFHVEDYKHYNKCLIETKRDILPNKNTINIIFVKLTRDGTEDISFYNKFKEDYKLFKMGMGISYTFKDLFQKNKIIIEDVIYNKKIN